MITHSNPALHKRGLRSTADLAQKREHGDRLRYLAGCRCDDCRSANTAYERERSQARKEGDWNGIVESARARDHLRWLSKKGVGRRSVAAASDVSETVLSDIRSGRKRKIRARTERLILAVTVEAAGDRSLVKADKTWKLINELLEAGFTKSRIAAELGMATPALQLNKNRVTLRNAHEIRKIHARLMASDEIPVDSMRAKSHIRALRAEWISALQIARELQLEHLLEDGELRLPPKIPRHLDKAIAALHERFMA